jgi:ElaB/YqjD/DUF883 family membrane-anchored ribosome-binding protein
MMEFFERSIPMSSEDLKIFETFALLIEIDWEIRLDDDSIIQKKMNDARLMKKYANKIKKDKNRLRKAAQKIILQKQIKELYEEERLSQSYRKRATEDLFHIIPWMTIGIYQDLGFDRRTYADSQYYFILQTNNIYNFIEKYRKIEIAEVIESISNSELYMWYNMVSMTKIVVSVIDGNVTNDDLYTWLNMVSISNDDMTIIIADKALNMKFLHKNVSTFVKGGNSNVRMKKNNSRFLEDFKNKEIRLLNSDIVSHQKAVIAVTKFLRDFELKETMRFDSTIASESSIPIIDENEKELGDCNKLFNSHKRKRRGHRFNRSGGLNCSKRSLGRREINIYKRHLEWADNYFTYEQQSLSKESLSDYYMS